MEFRAVKRQYLELKPKIDEAIEAVLDSGAFIAGAAVKALENSLAEYTGRAHCVSCANGTDAIELVMRAWGIGECDAVFVPDFTFFATAEPVRMLGAIPIFVDVRKDTFNMDPDSLEKAIISVKKDGRLNPKAVMAVDLFGQLADYGAIKKVTDKHGLFLFEDAAQSFGASYKGKKACSFGDASITSFFPTKPLGCYGDGGAVFTDDEDKAELIRSLTSHGKGRDKYDNVRVGRNSRLDTIQAAILNVKFEALIRHELSAINKAAELYTSYIKEIGINIQVPIMPEGMASSWAQYTICLPTGTDRQAVMRDLSEKDIPAMVYYATPLSKQKAFIDILDFQTSPCCVSERLSETVLSLPMHPYLQKADIEKVCMALKKSLGT